MVKIVWTELSGNDLKEIFDYIAQDSKRYASITVNKIYQRTQDIMNNPFAGRIVPEFGSKEIRELIMDKFRIVYRVVSDFQVDILRIYHSARLLTDDKLL
jgi:toxin ParE1/3/4